MAAPDTQWSDAVARFVGDGCQDPEARRMLEKCPSFPSRDDISRMTPVERRELEDIVREVADEVNEFWAHPDPVEEETLLDYKEQLTYLQEIFAPFKNSCKPSLDHIESGLWHVKEALDNPWDSKHDDGKVYFFHDDLNTIAEYAHGFTEDEEEDSDKEEDTEKEDEEDTEKEDEEEEDKEEGDEDAWYPYPPAAKKQRV
jgi:hypothetical protein